MTSLRTSSRIVLLVGALLAAVAGCSSSSTSGQTGSSAGGTAGGTGTAAPPRSAATSDTAAAPRKLRVLVTNDDGVHAPGIDAVVEGLRSRDDVEITVVAPLENRSGTGHRTTDGPLTVTDTTTESGFPAKAVAGFPADTIIWAFDGGVPTRPDVVVSGDNAGQNLGPVTAISGTVGAATEAAERGVPAIALSQGLLADGRADYESAVALLQQWLDEHEGALRDGSLRGEGGQPLLVNVNIPTCASGELRGLRETTTATDLAGRNVTEADCTSTAAPASGDDIDAFNVGYATIAELPVPGPSGG